MPHFRLASSILDIHAESGEDHSVGILPMPMLNVYVMTSLEETVSGVCPFVYGVLPWPFLDFSILPLIILRKSLRLFPNDATQGLFYNSGELCSLGLHVSPLLATDPRHQLF